MLRVPGWKRRFAQCLSSSGLELGGPWRASKAQQSRLTRIASLASSISTLSCSAIETQLLSSRAVIIGEPPYYRVHRMPEPKTNLSNIEHLRK